MKSKIKWTLQSVSYGHSQYLLQMKHLEFVSVFGNRLSGTSNVFSTSRYSSRWDKFADGSCHTITNHLELHCFALQASSDGTASGIRESIFELVSPRQFFSPSSYPLDLSGFGNPIGSNTTAGLALNCDWNSHALPPRQGGETIGRA